MEAPPGGHRLPEDHEREPVSPARQMQLLRETLATLSELPDDHPTKSTAIANTQERIAALEGEYPETRPN